ncbi:MAG: hypothetical protein JO364_21235 [Pseudonocardiales bacterium]|nr:hypothetical protein [Pseudonocardiales bacterium]MBV9032773.1 hypothetical protein [Pseudonocardiales bacterium]
MDPHYYPHSVQAVAHAWGEPAAEADLVDRLTQTVRAEHADDQHAA